MGSAVQFRLAPLFLFDLLIFGLMMERKQIYTPEFKRWFGDWPLAARAAAIRAMAAEPITTDLKYTRSEAKDLYCKIEKAVNKADGKTVMFYHGIFGKMYKPDGLFVRVIPQLKTLFENSLFAYSETDDRAGTARPDGTIHKERRNVVNYDNYVAKAFLNGKVYYVRFTIMNETDGKRGIHSSMVTNVSLYDETANVASVPVTHGGRLDTDGIVDTKLQDFFERAKKSSKVVDFDGYPLVVYHGTTKDFTTFSKKTIGKANNGRYGFFFTPDESLATDFTRRRWQNTESQPKKNAHNIAVYLNLRNPLIVTAYQYVMNAVDNMDLSGYDGIIITPFSKEEKARWDSIWGANSGSKEFDHNQYVVFSPNQIKSATANNGQFSPESNNILQGIDYSDAKFKVGDTVKCTAMGRPSYGEVFTIKKVHKIKGKYEYDGSNGVYNYEEYSLELIQRNKPYDPAECLRVLNYICIDCFKKPISFVTVGYDGIFLSYCLGGKFGEIEERLNQYLWGKDILKSFISSREKNKQGITYSIKNDAAILDYVKEQIDYPSLERKPEMFKVGNVYYDDKWVYQVVKAYRDEKTAADECRIAKINDKGSWDDSTYSVQTAALIFKDCTFYGNESTQLLSLEWEDKKAFYNKVKPFKSRVQAILDKYHSKAKICRTYAKGSHIKGGIVRPCDEVWIQSSPYDRFPLVEDDFDGNDELEYEMICMIADLRENKHYDKETDKLVENTPDDRDRRLRLAKAKAKALKMKLELMKI